MIPGVHGAFISRNQYNIVRTVHICIINSNDIVLGDGIRYLRGVGGLTATAAVCVDRHIDYSTVPIVGVLLWCWWCCRVVSCYCIPQRHPVCLLYVGGFLCGSVLSFRLIFFDPEKESIRFCSPSVQHPTGKQSI